MSWLNLARFNIWSLLRVWKHIFVFNSWLIGGFFDFLNQAPCSMQSSLWNMFHRGTQSNFEWFNYCRWQQPSQNSEMKQRWFLTTDISSPVCLARELPSFFTSVMALLCSPLNNRLRYILHIVLSWPFMMANRTIRYSLNHHPAPSCKSVHSVTMSHINL